MTTFDEMATCIHFGPCALQIEHVYGSNHGHGINMQLLKDEPKEIQQYQVQLRERANARLLDC